MKYLLASLLIAASFIVQAQTDSTIIKLQYYKDIYTKGLITAEDYAALRQKLLGIHVNPVISPGTKAAAHPWDTLSGKQLYNKGYEDANKYYTQTKAAFGGTLFASIFGSPVIGLIPAIACSSTTPADENLGFPDYDLMQDPNYFRGYISSAKKKKRDKVWTAWGIGCGVDMIAGLVVGLLVIQKH